ncbi:MAG: segregation/condensation protein A [Candidatus Pacearchaeota archaeon]|nr:segregation/condensation protein A [Candidatus Pacearchaeota archaeon]
MVQEKITQEQLYDLLISREPSWQSIIYELVRTEQLDPWDIDIITLANRFLDQIRKLEEQNFFITSKVLLAAAILLRMKSEILLESIKSTKEKEEKKIELAKPQQIITPDTLEEEFLIPKTPFPRARKISLQELMQALERAINTEQRRIKRKLWLARARKQLENVLPKPMLNIPKKIKEIWSMLKHLFYKEKKEKILFSELLSTKSREEKIMTFVPLVFLDNQKRIWLEQKEPFGEIEIFPKNPKEL